MPTRPSFVSILLTIALLLPASKLPAQSMTVIRELLHKKDFTAFKSCIDSSLVRPGTIRAYWRQLRDLLPGWQEGIVHISERMPGRNQGLVHVVGLVANGGNIIYYRLLEEDSSAAPGELWKPVDSFRSEAGMAQLKMAFQQLYGAPPDENDLMTSFQYGTACGIDGATPNMRVVQMLLVKERDIATLNSWLVSANLEKQVYAVDGLYRLKQEGYALTTEQQRLIGIIKNKKGSIATCEGCTSEDLPVADVLSPFVF